MPDTLTFDITYLYEDSVEGIAIPVTLIFRRWNLSSGGKGGSGSRSVLIQS